MRELSQPSKRNIITAVDGRDLNRNGDASDALA